MTRSKSPYFVFESGARVALPTPLEIKAKALVLEGDERVWDVAQ